MAKPQKTSSGSLAGPIALWTLSRNVVSAKPPRPRAAGLAMAITGAAATGAGDLTSDIPQASCQTPGKDPGVPPTNHPESYSDRRGSSIRAKAGSTAQSSGYP